MRAIVGITVDNPDKTTSLAKLERSAEELECPHVKGADSYLLTVLASDIADLERLLASINGWGETHTSIVFSTPIARCCPGLLHCNRARANASLAADRLPMSGLAAAATQASEFSSAIALKKV